MGVRSWEEDAQGQDEEAWPARRGAGVLPAALLALVVLAGLFLNGRSIGPGDERGLAHVLVAPVAALAGRFVEADDAVRLLAGKLVSALGAALAAAVLFAAIAHRRTAGEAGAAALLLAFGSSLFSAAQALSPEAVAAAAVSWAILCIVRAEDEPSWGGVAGLPLSLAVAFHPPAAPMAAVLAAGVIARYRLVGLRLLPWAVPGVVLLLVGGMRGWVPGIAGVDALGVLVSPARGAFVFTPVAIVAAIGLARSLRYEPWLAGSFGLAFLAHAITALLLPDDVPSWGTPALADAWPLLFFFLPAGLEATRILGKLVALLSVAIQVFGAFHADARWDRRHRDASGQLAAGALWDLQESPMAAAVREPVLHVVLPVVVERRFVQREHLVVIGAPSGSRITFAGERPVVTGAENTLHDVVVEGGGRVSQDRLVLQAGDALFLRVPELARPRKLELRLVGKGRGTLALQEGGFWNPDPRATERAVSGDFRLRLPYYYPESGGADLRLVVREGSMELRSVALVPPGEPENVIRLQGTPEG